MARIRTINPEFFRHHKLFKAEKETGLPLRVAFAGLWTCSDREGRFKWEPPELGIQCIPYDEVDFSRVLDALSTRGFVVKYESGGREYGHIPSFKDHQVINNREADSILPDPNDCKASDACGTRDPREDHADIGERKGKEGKGKEGGGRKRPIPADFVLDDGLVEYARVRHLDPKTELEKFRVFHKAKGSKFADWRSAFQKWCLKAVEFREKDKPRGELGALE